MADKHSAVRQRSAAAAAARSGGGAAAPTARQPAPAATPARSNPQKSNVLAYLLWLFLPSSGLHHFYLGRDVHCFLYAISFGLFGMGWLRDAWRLPSYVRAASSTPAWVEHQKTERVLYPSPPFWLSARLPACLLFGSSFGAILRCAWPPADETPLPEAVDAVAVAVLGVIGTALGTWLPGSLAPQRASLSATLLGAALGAGLPALAAAADGASHGAPVLGAICGLRWSTVYEPLPPRRSRVGVLKRALRLMGAVSVFWAVVGCGLYAPAIRTERLATPPFEMRALPQQRCAATQRRVSESRVLGTTTPRWTCRRPRGRGRCGSRIRCGTFCDRRVRTATTDRAAPA
jgi:hypothetical protein